MWQQTSKLIWVSLLCAAGLGSACQPATNTNVNAAINSNVNRNVNVNTNSVNSNIAASNTTSTSNATIETKEPEQYQATVTLKFELSGAQSVAVPPIKAEVAKNGADRRMEFNLPNGEKLIYIDHDGKQFVISPNRKQYAELTKEAVGFEVRKMLMPEQIVNQVKNLKGVEQVGEEKVDGRDTVKYRYGSTTNTQSKAGTVSTESTVLVDKETSLPLRSVTSSESQNGDVQGIKGLNFITEMSNIRMTADAELFKQPTDYQQVAPAQIKSQIDAVFSVAMNVLGQLMKSSAQPTATPNQ